MPQLNAEVGGPCEGDLPLQNETSSGDLNFSEPGCTRELVLAPAHSTAPLVEIAQKIQHGDQNAEVELYVSVQRGIKFWAQGYDLYQERSDLAHEIFIKCLVALRDGQVRDVNCFPGYIRTVAIRVVGGHCQRRDRWKLKHQDCQQEGLPAFGVESNCHIEEHLFRRQRLLEALKLLKPSEAAVLRRFYINEQDKETICKEMNLSVVQYRLLKSRAKARLIEVARKLRLRENLINLLPSK